MAKIYFIGKGSKYGWEDSWGIGGEISGVSKKKGYAILTDPAHPGNPLVKKDAYTEFGSDVLHLANNFKLNRTDYESIPSYTRKMPDGRTVSYRDGIITASLAKGGKYTFYIVERAIYNPRTGKYALSLQLPNRDNSRMYTALRLGDRKLTDFTLSYHRSDGQVLPVFR